METWRRHCHGGSQVVVWIVVVFVASFWECEDPGMGIASGAVAVLLLVG